MTDKPPVYKCYCGKAYHPPHFPYTRRCPCGVEMTVTKPTRTVENTDTRQTTRGVMWEKK